MVLRQLGLDAQIGSTTSNTSSAVLAGFSVTATGSGIGGISSVIIGLLPPALGGADSALCAVASPACIANARASVNARIRMLPFSGHEFQTTFERRYIVSTSSLSIAA